MKMILSRMVAALACLSILLPSVALAQIGIDPGARGSAAAVGRQAQAIYAGVLSRGGMTIEERCAREGIPWGSAGIGNAVSVPAGSGQTAISNTNATAVPVGYMLYVSSIDGTLYPTTSATGPIRAQILGTSTGSNAWPQNLKSYVIPSTGGIVGPVAINQFFRSYLGNTPNYGFGLTIRENAGATASWWGNINVSGCRLTDDPNFGAPRIDLQIGDSTCAGTAPSSTATAWYFQLRDYYIQAGKDIRLILKCNSGSTSSDHDGWRKQGYYEVGPDVALINWVLGINDAAQGISAATYIANATSFWNYASKRWPTAQVWFYGPAPLANTTYEANAVALRSALSTWVASVNSPRIHFCDLGTAYAPTDATKTTDGIHPNDAGHAAIYAVVKACHDAAGGSNILAANDNARDRQAA